MVFDLDTEDLPGGKPGEIVPFDPSFDPYLDDLLAGREVPPIISDDAFGYLLTVYDPIRDSAGLTQCYAAVDISMDDISAYIMIVIRNLFFMSLVILLLFFLLSVFLTDRGIVRPMKHMEKKAYHDAMTGLLNRTALSEAYAVLSKELSEGRKDLAIVMIDINFLKKINDTYGHDKGNEYLINGAKLICEVFGNDQVYRSGGDEIVLIRRGEELRFLPEKILEFKERMNKLQEEECLPPWEKVSAAVGMAHFEEGTDRTPQDVVKRADQRMYENKLAMKAASTD